MKASSLLTGSNLSTSSRICPWNYKTRSNFTPQTANDGQRLNAFQRKRTVKLLHYTVRCMSLDCSSDLYFNVAPVSSSHTHSPLIKLLSQLHLCLTFPSSMRGLAFHPLNFLLVFDSGALLLLLIAGICRRAITAYRANHSSCAGVGLWNSTLQTHPAPWNRGADL